MHSEFIHLHLHTQYSLLDGACKIPDLISLANSYHMPAVTITDHGNMFGAIEFYLQATDYRPQMADRFIFITGYAADPKVNVFLTRTGCTYLIKPFPVQTLIDCLKQMLA